MRRRAPPTTAYLRAASHRHWLARRLPAQGALGQRPRPRGARRDAGLARGALAGDERSGQVRPARRVVRYAMLASACWSSANTTRWSSEVSQRFCHPAHHAQDGDRRAAADIWSASVRGATCGWSRAACLNEGVDIPDCGVAIIVSGNATRREYIQRLGRCCVPKRRAPRSTSWSPKAPPRSASPTADGHRNVPGLERAG